MRRYMFFGYWGNHCFYVNKSNELLGFGSNTHGELCLGNNDFQRRALVVKFFERTDIQNISLGLSHSLFRVKSGSGHSCEVFSCGRGNEGQLALGDTSDRFMGEPVYLEEKIPIIEIFTSSASSFFLCDGGAVFVSGENSSGVLCLGDNTNRLTGTKIRHLENENIEMIYPGYSFVFFLSADGTVFCGGQNNKAQLGLGNTTNVNLPTQLTFFKDRELNLSTVVPGDSTVYFICEDESDSELYRGDQQVYISGSNEHGEYGNGRYAKTSGIGSLPQLSRTIQNIDGAKAGCHSFIWKSRVDGEWYGTGGLRGTFFGLDSEDITSVNLPVKIHSIPSEWKRAISEVEVSGNDVFFICDEGRTVYHYGKTGDSKWTQKCTNANIKRFGEVDGDGQGDLDSKIMNLQLFSPHSRRGEIERMEFVLSLPRDLEIEFLDATVECFATLLDPTSSLLANGVVNGKIQVSKRLHTTVFDDDFLHTFAWAGGGLPAPNENGGKEDDYCEDRLCENVQLYVDLYVFFNALGMNGLELCLLQSIPKIPRVDVLVKLFAIAFQTLEKLHDQRDCSCPFESALCCTVFHTLAKSKCGHVDAIRKQKVLLKVLQKLGVWNLLVNSSSKDDEDENENETSIGLGIEHLRRFEGFKNNGEVTRREVLFQKHCTRLYHTRHKTGGNCNYTIVSADEKEIFCHREIIAVRSDYFFKVIRFGGVETRREGFLLLENLNHAELCVMVEFSYTGEISGGATSSGSGSGSARWDESDLLVLMNVLEEIQVYEENELMEAIVRKIISISKSLVEKGTFLECTALTRDIGHKFANSNVSLPVKLKSRIVGEWMGMGLSEKDLGAAFEKSALKQLEVPGDELCEDECWRKLDYGDRLGVLEGRVATITKCFGGRITSLENEIRGVKRDVGEILSVLKRENGSRKRKKDVTRTASAIVERSRRKRKKMREQHKMQEE